MNEIWLVILHQYLFISCDKCTIILIKDINRGKRVWYIWEHYTIFVIILYISTGKNTLEYRTKKLIFLNLPPLKPEGILYVAIFQNPVLMSCFMHTAHFEIWSKAKAPLSHYFSLKFKFILFFLNFGFPLHKPSINWREKVI